MDTIQTLEEHDGSLPDKLQQLLNDKLKVKANCESQAKGLQHTTDILSWLLAETIIARRDAALKQSTLKLSNNTKNVLRLQPFNGPFLFNGKVDELLKKDGEQSTASLILSLSESMKNKQQKFFTNNNYNNKNSNKSWGQQASRFHYNPKYNEGNSRFF